MPKNISLMNGRVFCMLQVSYISVILNNNIVTMTTSSRSPLTLKRRNGVIRGNFSMDVGPKCQKIQKVGKNS